MIAHASPFVNDIAAIVKLENDTLLLATEEGLWCFDASTEHFSPFLADSELAKTEITAIARDSNQCIWIGTLSQGLYKYNQQDHSLERYTSSTGLSDDNITCLLLDSSHELWIGTVSGGLNAYDRMSRSFSTYRKQPGDNTSLLSDHISTLCEYDGDLWVGTNDGIQVRRHTNNHFERIELPSSLPHRIWSMANDHAGKIWIAVAELGLFSYKDGMLTEFTSINDANRSLHAIRALYFDPAATSPRNVFLWIGTRYGMNKVLIKQNVFHTYVRNQDSLQLNRGAVLSLCEDHNGILWVGLWGGGLNGLRRVRDGYRRIYTIVQDPAKALSLPNNDVFSVIEDRSGNLWIGTGGGVAMLDSVRKTIVSYKHRKGDSTSLAGNGVSRIFEDRSGTMWMCTSEGISKFIPGVPAHFTNYFSSPQDAHPITGKVISDVIEDDASNHWIATFGKGLVKLEKNGAITRYAYPQDTTGIRENTIYFLIEDHLGMLWLSIREGLVSFDPRSGTFQRHELDQLFQAHIFGIAEDTKGNLWLSTSIGLARFNPATSTFLKFDENDGIPFTEFFSGFYRNKNGSLFLGGIDGIVEFLPESVITVVRPPEIVITSLKVTDKEMLNAFETSTEMRLSHDKNFLSFSFAALDYVNPQHNRFFYTMEGVDEQWIDAGTRNFTSYTNLSPGKYVFRVKGCNSDNVWNEAGTSVSILITPPYWQTWWFRALIVVLIGSATYTAFRYRLNKLLEVERLRLRIADDLHDDVGSNLSTIAMVSRAVQRTSELSAASRRKLEEIYDTAITSSESMKDIVWFIKPKNDTLDDLVLRMKDVTSSLLVNIEHDFRAPDSGSSTRVSIDFKRNFFLAFKEILTNIVKHASATGVQIRVEQRDGMLETIIQDNGQGFDLTDSGTTRRGNGLVSLQNRAKSIGGVCEITSEHGKGTRVKFLGKL